MYKFIKWPMFLIGGLFVTLLILFVAEFFKLKTTPLLEQKVCLTALDAEDETIDRVLKYMGRSRSWDEENLCLIKNIEYALKTSSDKLAPYCPSYKKEDGFDCFQKILKAVHQKTLLSPAAFLAAYNLSNELFRLRYPKEGEGEETKETTKAYLALLHHYLLLLGQMRFELPVKTLWPEVASLDKSDQVPQNYWAIINEGSNLFKYIQLTEHLYSEKDPLFKEMKVATLIQKVFFDDVSFLLINSINELYEILPELLNKNPSVAQVDSFMTAKKMREKALEHFIAFFRPYCQEGLADNCLKIGDLYKQLGKPAPAKEHFLLGCGRMKGESCERLGIMDQEEKEHEKASRHFMMGCLHGNKESCLRCSLEELFLGNLGKSSEILASLCDGKANDLQKLACRSHARLKTQGNSTASLKGLWKGEYLCLQGKTHFSLKFDQEQNGVFSFNFEDLRKGEFDVAVEKEVGKGERYLFTPVSSSVSRPESKGVISWRTAPFFLDTIAPNMLIGLINDPQCSFIWAEKKGK